MMFSELNLDNSFKITLFVFDDLEYVNFLLNKNSLLTLKIYLSGRSLFKMSLIFFVHSFLLKIQSIFFKLEMQKNLSLL
ncbi:hypothetical protein J6P52_05780 [bacterium]|nr:hypothetical protein [bacterium]